MATSCHPMPFHARSGEYMLISLCMSMPDIWRLLKRCFVGGCSIGVLQFGPSKLLVSFHMGLCFDVELACCKIIGVVCA